MNPIRLKRRDRFTFFLLAGLFLILSPPARAELYYFKDPGGAFHFTNMPDDARYKNIKNLKPEKLKTGPPSTHYNDYLELIEISARKYRIDPLLIRALIKIESDYDPYAVSDSGAQGLMQLMPETARWMEVNDPFNPKENIEGGVKYFKRLLSLFNGQLVPSVAAYHAGEKMVQKFNNQIPPIDSTQKYVRKVILQYYSYHGIKNTYLKPNSIYRVEKTDGTVIFTNRPSQHQGLYKEIAYR